MHSKKKALCLTYDSHFCFRIVDLGSTTAKGSYWRFKRRMKSHFKTSKKHVNGKGRLEQAREPHAEHIENYFILILKETFNLYFFFGV